MDFSEPDEAFLPAICRSMGPVFMTSIGIECGV